MTSADTNAKIEGGESRGRKVGNLRDGRVRCLIKCTNTSKERVVGSKHSTTINHIQSITHSKLTCRCIPFQWSKECQSANAAIKNFGAEASMCKALNAPSSIIFRHWEIWTCKPAKCNSRETLLHTRHNRVLRDQQRWSRTQECNEPGNDTIPWCKMGLRIHQLHGLRNREYW